MRQKDPATPVYFVRHGQTDFPLDRIYCDQREDPELNSSGMQQAKSAAELLRDAPLAAIYASPARRTDATATAVNAFHKLDVQYREALRERHFGIWEGLYFHEIENRYPDEYRRWKKDNAGFKPEGGENIHDLALRLNPVLDEIRANHAGKAVAVVTHVGPIRTFIAQALGLPLAEFRRLTIDYAAISRVDYGARQHNLMFLNVGAVLRLG